MPNFMKFGGTRTSGQYGEMYTSRTFYIFYRRFPWEALQKKILNNFKRLMAWNVLQSVP